jgi:hypothetical protein
MIATFITAYVLTLLLAALIYWRQDVSHKRACAVYESCLAKADARATDALDRLFVAKGQAPTGTNMPQAHAAREQERTQRRQDSKGVQSSPMTIMRQTLADGEKVSR